MGPYLLLILLKLKDCGINGNILDRDDWEYCLENCPKLVISSRDNLINTFSTLSLLHPGQIKRIYPDRDLHCPRCLTQLGTFFHMFWECPKTMGFWPEVFEIINTRLQVANSYISRVDLVGHS